MNHKFKKSLLWAFSGVMAVSMATSVNAEGEETAATALSGTQRIVVTGDDWGPTVSKTVLHLNSAIDAASVSKDDFNVQETKTTPDWANMDYAAGKLDMIDGTFARRVTDAYTSDANGNRTTTASEYVTIELYSSPDEGNPFVYDMFGTGHNDWSKNYELDVALTEGNTLTSGEKEFSELSVEKKIDLRDKSLQISDADVFGHHEYTGETGIKYPYGTYAPAEDGKKHPLVIWLHGAGEGGSDVDIDLLGNKVTALASDEFQEAMGGAYVLTPQTPTMWMDGGNGSYQSGEKGSMYTKDLTALIEEYIASNPNVDPDRVIIGGCSNGGYMTMEMILKHPDLFAAAYPICEAYADANITDDQIQMLADSGMGIWFTYAKTDGTVTPSAFSEPTYARLKEAGADVHMSSYASVLDTTGRFKNPKDESQPYEYNGHWSWTYFFNDVNVCDEHEGENQWEWMAEQTRAVEVTGTQKVVIEGDDWGPAVSKTIIELSDAVDASSVNKDALTVTETKEALDWTTFKIGNAVTERKVTDAYLSDAKGNRSDAETGKYVTVEMYTSPDEGSPFLYDIFNGGKNRWVNTYELAVAGKLTSDGRGAELNVTAAIDLKDKANRISETADLASMKTFTASSGKKYSYGEFAPAKDSGKNPLVIWLHGAGEGGDDNYIDLLGNEVTSLYEEEFQKTMKGAYVLTPQAPTMWMDAGDGSYQSGDKGSVYYDDLMELIKTYVKNNSDIDTDRIIVGGCSNGGYMTMELILKNPEYFAAAYPICEAFSDEFITDDQIQALADSRMEIWFTYAKNDTTVDPKACAIPTIERLKKAGATVHTSVWDDVHDTTGRFTNEDGSAYQYQGHWSWTYFFNNENKCDDKGENMWQWMSTVTLADKTYAMLEGANNKFTAGSDIELRFRSEMDFAKFKEVRIDGKVLDPKFYTAEEGSTVVTLHKDYVKTLSAGDHKVEIIGKDGSAIASFTVTAEKAADTKDAAKGSAKTGDSSNLFASGLITMFAGLAAAGFFFVRRRFN